MFLGLAAAVLAAGCGNDDPTAVGGPLYPEGAVHTYEIVLPASDFLVFDTTFSGYTQPGQTGLIVAANDFGGTLDAHGLMRFTTLPTTVQYNDSSGTAHTDTIPTFIRARVILYTDSASISDNGSTPATLALNVSQESWDRSTATWQNRVDSTGARLPWEQSGGTMGEQIGTAEWTPGTDSLIFELEPGALETLRDSAVSANGLILSSQTPGVRVQGTRASLIVDARPSERPDTVVHASSSLFSSTFVFTPPAGPPTTLRVGGVPEWRSVLEFKAGWDTVTFACPGVSGCRIPLADVTVTRAEILLEPVPPQPGFRPGDTLGISVRPMARSELIPLARSPLGAAVSTTVSAAVPDAFTGDAGTADRVALPVTSFINSLATPVAEGATASPRTVMLLPYLVNYEFGFGAFAGRGAGPLAPQLRLVLTASEGVLLR